ncbi:MAG: MFS transporter [Oscillospiraceae bacterium]|nr:MFS transporter [Oscillospiraceae bacterium]
MVSLLLAIIYASFISLGLPDSILGSAWPSMYGSLGVSVSYAGVLSLTIAVGTVISSLFSAKLIHKIGTGWVTAISVGMTAAALLGFSISNSFIALCLWSIPYGLGAGSVDVALNNFVAVNYKSKHMSWLHCFWGIGASLGPYIMGLCLTAGGTWRNGYRTISLIQIALTVVLIFSIPLWKKQHSASTETIKQKRDLKAKELVRIPGAKAALLAFFCYCALEITTGMWASSYMVLAKGMSAETAAKWASLFYLGITGGRFVSGFVTIKLGDRRMVALGQVIVVLGVISILLPFGNVSVLAGLILVGLGCAPIFPSLLHETPENFGADLSQSIMGMQMACAYVGAALMPPLFGILADYVSIKLYPSFLLFFALLLIFAVIRLNKAVKHKDCNG